VRDAVQEEEKVSHAITAWNLKTIFKKDKKHKPCLLNVGNVVVVEVVDYFGNINFAFSLEKCTHR
jgi:hypothetical protein